jgi:hypothetical protein
MSIEAMKEALEAFEHIQGMSWSIVTTATCKRNIANLRQAIEQAEKQEPERDKPLRLSPMYEYGHIHDAELPWVGLNWDDIPDVFVGDIAFMQGAKWAEAKLKEKNT